MNAQKRNVTLYYEGAGHLKRVPRTDNNPHGLLITNWRTLLNKDVEQKTKLTY